MRSISEERTEAWGFLEAGRQQNHRLFSWESWEEVRRWLLPWDMQEWSSHLQLPPFSEPKRLGDFSINTALWKARAQIQFTTITESPPSHQKLSPNSVKHPCRSPCAKAKTIILKTKTANLQRAMLRFCYQKGSAAQCT